MSDEKTEQKETGDRTYVTGETLWNFSQRYTALELRNAALESQLRAKEGEIANLKEALQNSVLGGDHATGN